MSIHQLPPEILIEIVRHLADTDKACLRITCRAFNSLIPAPAFTIPKKRSSDSVHFAPYRCERYRDSRLEFLSRLLRPGNLYTSNEKLCGEFYRVQHHSKFSIKITFRDFEVCDACMADLVSTNLRAGERQTYNGKSLLACYNCGEVKLLSQYHSHLEFGKVSHWFTLVRICSECHLRWCSSLVCPGWSVEFVQKHKVRFCLAGRRGWVACGMCGSCRWIENLSATLVPPKPVIEHPKPIPK